jgi:hypothetical protein
MPNSKPVEILQRSDSTLTEQRIREWLVEFAELHRKNGAPYPLTPVMTQLWIDLLRDLDPRVLDMACRKVTEQGCRREFPTPADIRGQIDSAQLTNCEEDWQYLQGYIREWVHPDVHFTGAPELPAEIDHAARAAGGVYFLRGCSHEELGWRKKTFIEDLIRSRKDGDLAARVLAGAELHKLLQEFAHPKNRLPPPDPKGCQQAAEETASLKKTMLSPHPSRPCQVLTEEELQRQKEFVLRK